MGIPPKAIYMFNPIPIKILMTFITEIKRSTLHFNWKHKRQQIYKATQSKRAKLKLTQYLTSNYMLLIYSNKNNMVLEKKIHKTSGTEDSDTNPHSHARLLFYKCAQIIRWRKNGLFNKFC
jgi:hypothetical protein